MDRFEVDEKAEYVPGWISFLSTAVGILRAIGEEADLVDAGGYSGYAFHLNTAVGETRPSAPTVAPFDLFREGLESLGRQVTFGWTGPCYTPSTNEEDLARAKAFFEDVKSTLTRIDRPVGIWGIPVPEFGIVNGYDGDSYLVSTFRSLRNESRDEGPIKYDLLNAPGGLSKLVFGEPLDLQAQDVVDKAALERAIHIAKGVKSDDKEVDSAYIAGPDALTHWADIIEKGIVRASEEEYNEVKGKMKLNYHGNAYVAACTREGMELAASFLMRFSRRYRSETYGGYFEEASHHYKHAAEKLRIFTELFPFNADLNWSEVEFSDEKRTVGSGLLRDAKPHVLVAIESMEKAYANWG